MSAALSCDESLEKDAIMESAQCAAHYAVQLRTLGGLRAIEYNVVHFHSTLVLVLRSLVGALASGAELVVTRSTLDMLVANVGGLGASGRSDAVLPFVAQFAMQYCGEGRRRRARVGAAAA